MIHTRICDLLAIVHPIVLGGMGTATTAPLVAAVSNAGGFGTLGTSAFTELAFVYPADNNAHGSGAAYPTTPGHFEEVACQN